MNREINYRRFQFFLGIAHPVITGALLLMHVLRKEYGGLQIVGCVLMFLVSCRLGMFLVRRSKNKDAQFGSVGIDKTSSETEKDSVDLTATIGTVLFTFFVIYIAT